MTSLRLWEFVGEFLTAGAALFGAIYALTSLSVVSINFRAVAFSVGPAAALGGAGLALAGLGAFAAIILGGNRTGGKDFGVLLLFWTDFAVLLIGDSLFYALQPAPATVLLFGVVSAVLTSAGVYSMMKSPERAV